MGRIVSPHSLHYPELAFNGEPESLRLEKHPKVCTKGTEPLALEVPAAKAGHSWAFNKPPRLRVGSMTDTQTGHQATHHRDG